LGRWLAVLWLCAPGVLLAAPADEIRALMERGNAAAAYALGKKHPEALGDATFDFYFGIAALDTGHAGEGVLALERYLLRFPANQSAQLQLARGYFLLGEDARARQEFEALRRQNPPADAVATIDRFLDAIRLRETRYTVSTGAYIELGLGADTNVNGGVANAAISLPNIGAVIVSPGNTKNSDTFTHLGAGGYVSYPIAPGVALFGNAQGELKLHHHDTAFDQGNYNLAGGVSVLSEKNLYRFGANYGSITVDDNRFRDTYGLSAEWQHQLDERQSFNFGAQLARLKYPEQANRVRDADFHGLAAGYRVLFSHDWQPILGAGANYGDEDVIAQGRDDLARRIYGVRASLSFTPAAKWGVAVGGLYQESRYKANDLILGVTRRDKFEAVDAAVSYLYTRNLSLRLEGMRSRNRSNIELFSFPRDLVAFKVRYEFK
jgi:hypothetical protein